MFLYLNKIKYILILSMFFVLSFFISSNAFCELDLSKMTGKNLRFNQSYINRVLLTYFKFVKTKKDVLKILDRPTTSIKIRNTTCWCYYISGSANDFNNINKRFYLTVFFKHGEVVGIKIL